MTLTVVSTNVAEPRHARVIEVFATGSRGGSHEWTVDFNRNGTIWGGYRHKPYLGYVEAHVIPLEITVAAKACYEKEYCQ